MNAAQRAIALATGDGCEGSRVERKRSRVTGWMRASPEFNAYFEYEHCSAQAISPGPGLRNQRPEAAMPVRLHRSAPQTCPTA